MSSKNAEAEPADGSVEVSPAQLAEFQSKPGSGDSRPWIVERKAVLRSVPLKVHAVLGRANLTVGKLSGLKDGDVFALEEDATAPVELHVEGQLIGRGELVVVGDKYGIRVIELASLDGP